MKPNIILILVMGGIILIMGASSHPTSEEPLTYEYYSLLNIDNMLEKSKFLVSFDCQNEKFCEELIITYRTEELRPYLIFPRVKLNPNHLHVYHTKRIISTRKNMPRKSNITLTFSKNQKLFTLSLKILSTFSNPLSNEN